MEGKARPGRRKTGRIDNIRSRTDGEIAMARARAKKRMAYADGSTGLGHQNNNKLHV